MEQQIKGSDLADRILDSAFILFREYGFRAVTMDDIANHMGISKRTLYTWFSDKDELAKIAVERRIKVICTECEAIRDRSEDAIEEMVLCMQYLDGLFRKMNPVFLLEMQKFHAEAFRFFQDYRDNFLIDMIRTNLKKGIAQDVYRQQIQVEILSIFRMESSMLCLRPDLFPKDRFEMVRIHRELMEHFLYGVATPKGHKLIEKYKLKYLQNL